MSSTFIGLNVVAIYAPQDRNSIELHVITENNEIGVVRFSNDNGKPVDIEFSHLNILLYSDNGRDSLGEFEELNEISGGYEVIGDFGILWIKCKGYEYKIRRA